MHATKVEMRDEKRNRVFEVLDRLGVAQRQACEASVKQSDGQVGSFDMAGANLTFDWPTRAMNNVRADAVTGRIAPS